MNKVVLLNISALADMFSAAFIIPNLFRYLFADGLITLIF
ncbi:hypothetical protein Holit_00877 [Hollandina sp. SP2]